MSTNHGNPVSTGFRALAMLATLAIIAWLSLVLPPMQPPAAVPEGAPAGDFSAERAREELRWITTAPRPQGSPGHEITRERLLRALQRLGLEPQTRRATVMRRYGSITAAVEAENIVARVPGTDSTGAVVLMTHYDSVVHSPGATDAGNGVAAILETVRALADDFPLRNDLIVLITDAEEIGLMGARAFVDEHPWSADTGVVLNLEGRGHTGPVSMFRTVGANGRMIDTLAEAVPHALADSLTAEAFRHMPNDTDLSVFGQAGYAGMDFANAHGVTHYHMPLDSFEAADPRSLQHTGNYLLALTRAFGKRDLAAPAGAERVYFSLPGVGLVHYPAAWVLPLAVVFALAIAAWLTARARRGELRLRGAAWSGLRFVALLAGLPLAVALVWMLIRGGIPETAHFWHDTPYDSGFYLVALCLVALAVQFAFSTRTGRRSGDGERLLPVLTLWMLLALVTAVWAPAASHAFLWPAVFAAAALVLGDIAGDRRPALQDAARVACAIPILLVMVPTIEATAVMTTFAELPIVILILAMTLGLLLPAIDRVGRALGWKLPAIPALLAAAMLAYGLTDAGFNEERKKPNGVNYIADAGEDEAWWYSLDAEPDDWTRRYLGDDPRREDLPDWAPENPFGNPRTPWIRQAEVVRTDAPDARVVEDFAADDGRRLRLRLELPDDAYVTVIRIPDVPGARLLRVNGKDAPQPPDDEEELTAYYYGTAPASPEIELRVPPDREFGLYLRSNIPGLPALKDGSHPERPPHMMTAGRNADLTQLQRSIPVELPDGGREREAETGVD